MIKLVIILSLISNLAFAQNAIHLNKDDKAPWEGDLLTLEVTKRLYDDSIEKSSLQKQLDLETQNNNILTQEKQILLDQNDKLIEAASKDHNLNNYEKAGFFIAGLATVVLGAWAIERVK